MYESKSKMKHNVLKGFKRIVGWMIRKINFEKMFSIYIFKNMSVFYKHFYSVLIKYFIIYTFLPVRQIILFYFNIVFGLCNLYFKITY